MGDGRVDAASRPHREDVRPSQAGQPGVLFEMVSRPPGQELQMGDRHTLAHKAELPLSVHNGHARMAVIVGLGRECTDVSANLSHLRVGLERLEEQHGVRCRNARIEPEPCPLPWMEGCQLFTQAANRGQSMGLGSVSVRCLIFATCGPRARRDSLERAFYSLKQPGA